HRLSSPHQPSSRFAIWSKMLKKSKSKVFEQVARFCMSRSQAVIVVGAPSLILHLRSPIPLNLFSRIRYSCIYDPSPVRSYSQSPPQHSHTLKTRNTRGPKT